jgi:NAD(P)-dependent dehydrogenase (short-subunit alcohol dehydrogenase family)
VATSKPLTDACTRPGRLSGKVAVVGGGGGFAIGRATVRRFVAEGAHVYAMDRAKDRLGADDFAEQLRRDTGVTVRPLTVAPLDAETFRISLEQVVREMGRLDVFVNFLVAGRTTASDDWQWTLNSPFAPTYFGLVYAAELMSRGGGGSIVNTSSVSGVVLSPSIAPLDPLDSNAGEEPILLGAGSYGAAKATIGHLTREYAVRYGRRNVRVNAIAPGFMATPFTLRSIHGDYRSDLEQRIPLGHLGEGLDIANLALFLASDEAKYVTGQLIVVDGGYSARSR